MRLWLFRLGDVLLSSYWFVPTLMALGAAVLSIVTVGADVYLGSGWLKDFDWLFLNEPEGARGLLSTIAGSMITVAGVTFSITIAVVAQTTAQFGPRLMTNFMQDRGNQITLGTFIATFLYCLLILRTVRDADESAAVFVPHIAILFALLLAVASISVLIYFIHHVPESIHISNLVARVGQQLIGQMNRLFPTKLGHGADDDPDGGVEAAWRGRFDQEAAPIVACGNGYVQFIDGDSLLAHAREHDLVLHVRERPGSFVSEERVLALAWPGHRVDDRIAGQVRRGFALGGYRSPAQDVTYLVHRLIEVAARALSPGVNDLFTATNAMDWLGSALSNLAGRKVPPACRYDDAGDLRVIAEPVSFQGLADGIFDRLRPYVQGDRNAALHLMKIIRDVAQDTRTAGQRAVLLRHATALRAAAEEALTQERDLTAIRQGYDAVVRSLAGPSPPPPLGAVDGPPTWPARGATQR